MIDKYRLDDLRLESGEKGELARWVIQLQRDLDYERRKVSAPTALAAMDAEPVAWLWTKTDGERDVTLTNPSNDEDCHDAILSGWDYQPLFTAPPAPVVNAEPVADVVAWHKEGEERTCDIRWRRFDVAPGPLFAVAQPVPIDNTFIPKNLDRALGVVGVALPESKEEFNFQIERWIQRLIDRVIRYADEFKEQPAPVVDAEPAKYHIGDTTMQNVFKPTGMTDITDLQAVFDQVEIALNSPVIPDGWQLVPVEPTLEMIKSGANAASTGMLIPGMYRAMLAAAPQQEGM